MEFAGRVVKLAICDCDGVIFDSNSLKTDAYRASLQDLHISPDNVERFIQLHTADASVARGIKFKKFFTDMIEVDDPAFMVAAAEANYAANCDKLYMTLTPVKEALEFAQRCPQVWVVSGANGGELASVFERHNIARHYSGVLGSPTTKPEHVADILKATGVQAEEALFIGDGFTDFRTAKAAGIHFCFLSSMTDWKDADRVLEGETGVTKCASWTDILTHCKF